MMTNKLRSKITGMFFYNIMLLGWVLLNLRMIAKGIQSALWAPVGEATKAITACSYSWTGLTLIISENGKYSETVIVNNFLCVTLVIAVLYNIYCIIRVFKLQDSEALSENKTMFNDGSK
ncbi:hypothetical protein [Clostridium lacusfryxellense]|uniref:hypothetical protein n=1 Tax=Clostridium lacusfryxellense TaxID=205328 RepID=UPI001C0BDA1F|nr:hypothetical protein [Clostridium lacusfryxellense]MBU3113685.1 hypothetical protein [Clostridium lacusfryxellense]